MKALIVTPYLDGLGGGERYMLTIASILEQHGYQVTYGWENASSITRLAKLLAIPLRTPSCDPIIKRLYHSHNPLAMYFATRPYRVVVYLSDGSLPTLGGKNNIVHFQVPFHNINGRDWKNQLKLKTINHIIVNSQFTKNIIDHEYGCNSQVLYPPVVPLDPSPHKQNLVLSVGRFDPSLNIKHQEVMIDAFKELSPLAPTWRLVLVGGSTNSDWIKKLNQQAASYPIEIITNASHASLQKLYAEAKIYWHAAGYGVDEQKNPELTEHFGISTVEAISAGAVPLVVGRGGQTEIIRDPNFFWNTKSELITKTLKVIAKPTTKKFDISEYSLGVFKTNLAGLL